MRRSSVIPLICMAILAISTTSWSKGATIKILIDGDNLSAPVEISDPDIVSQFNIWNGAGVSTRGPDGVPHPPAHLDPEKTAGRFIDWPRGIATDLPSGMQRFEVTFFIGGRKTPIHDGKYLIAYEIDPTNRRGYVYLPRWHGSYISHGVEGNWFFASDRWDELIMPFIQQASENSSASSSRVRFGCVVGTASMTEDGAIRLYRLDEHGNNILNYRYQTDSQAYESVKEHIGDIVPGEPVEVSCWPPRS